MRMDLKTILNEKNRLPSKVVSLKKEPMQTQTGFLSEFYNLTLSLENGDSVKLFLKTPLTTVEDESMQIFVTVSQALAVTEFSFYEKIYPELDKIIKELKLQSPLPKCYYVGASKDGKVIILEDLSHLQLPSLQKEIPESDVRSILRSLAVVQAACCELQLRRKKSMVDLFPFLKTNDTVSAGVADMIKNNINHFKDYFAKEHPDKKKLLDLGVSIALDTKISKPFHGADGTNYFFSHGDVWNNDIFIKDNDCRLIDYQCVSGGCPLGDIMTFLVTGTDLGPEPSKRLDSHVRCYLDLLIECCGNSAALKERVEKQVVPFMTSSKMIKLALQFGVKIILASWDAFLDTQSELAPEISKSYKERAMRNLYNILSDLSR